MLQSFFVENRQRQIVRHSRAYPFVYKWLVRDVPFYAKISLTQTPPNPTPCKTPIFSERHVHVHVRYRRSLVARPSLCLSVICNVRAPYSGDLHFPQCLHAILRLSSHGIFPSGGGELNAKGVAGYIAILDLSNAMYISETVQDRS